MVAESLNPSLRDGSTDVGDAKERFRFGRFELDPAAGELLRDGRRQRLQAQPFKLLLLLARRAGTLVTHDEIRGELWGKETFVEFDQAVHYAIRQAREALGDSAERPLYIETVARRGYRFIAPVERISADSRGVPAPAVRRVGTTVRLQKALWANIAELRLEEARRQRAQVIFMAAVIAILVVIVAYLVWRR